MEDLTFVKSDLRENWLTIPPAVKQGETLFYFQKYLSEDGKFRDLFYKINEAGIFYFSPFNEWNRTNRKDDDFRNNVLVKII